MADFSITVQNSIRSFGPAPSTKWGAPMTWGVSFWGEGSDLIQSVGKMIGESITADFAVAKQVDRIISNSLSSDFEMTVEYLCTGNGYKYVFPGNVTDADERSSNTYSASTAASTTWSEVSDTDSAWGEA